MVIIVADQGKGKLLKSAETGRRAEVGLLYVAKTFIESFYYCSILKSVLLHTFCDGDKPG
jgi:hypothetical protein